MALYPIFGSMSSPVRFVLSPLIRGTLLLFYLVLTGPLPVLAEKTGAPGSPVWWWVGLPLGFAVLWGALSERVEVTDGGLAVRYPWWFPFRGDRFLPWEEVVALKAKTTGQGGLVYYFLTRQGEGFLLPMRVAGFARLVALVQERTGIDTRDVKPLAQPWMYLALLTLSLLLGLLDVWVWFQAVPHLG
ncbi:MAG: hypothetical protein ACUVSQ_04870 [Pseudanabaenaceae cyanobacterium]